jgi:endoglucanase
MFSTPPPARSKRVAPSHRWRALLAVFTLGAASGLFGAAGAPAPAFHFQRGVSIAHWMAKVYHPDGPGASWFGAADIDWIAAQGFDHIRYPLDGRLVWRADGTLDEQKLAPLVKAMHQTRALGLGVVLDLHFLPGGAYSKDNQAPAIFTDPRARAEAAACWGALARRFAGEDSYLRFELINEPMAPRNEQLNDLNDALIAAIRQVDVARVLYVTTNLSSTFATLPDLRVPADPHTAIVLHYDEPMVFTHQRASWKQCPPDMPLVEFPGRVPDLRKLFPKDHFAYQASLSELGAASIAADFDRAAEWLRLHAPGREIYLGAFGVNEMAPDQSRTNYIHAVSQAATQRDWGWAVWSYNGMMGVRDARGAPTPVLSGLFGSIPR